ncbi:hypothetical protein R1flu_014833 [Riccia fluitans]|uniref:YDG domain-containing protein n=1 Tax=Riccia fluitans TaxID=41844 RepID=A0ABD1YKD0_9MARC
MSRTIPDLHHRQRTHPDPGDRRTEIMQQLPGEQRRDRFSSPRLSDDYSSGDICVVQGEGNRLIFKSEIYNRSINKESSTYPRLKDSNRANNYVQLRWQFHHCFLQAEKSKDLLVALDKIIRILKELDVRHSQLRQGRRYPNNGCVSGPAIKLGIPERSYTKVESIRCKNFVIKDGEDLGSPEATRERSPGTGLFGMVYDHVGVGKRKSREIKDRHGPLGNCERKKIYASVNRTRNNNKRIQEMEPDFQSDDWKDYEREEEDSMSDEQQRPKSSHRYRDICGDNKEDDYEPPDEEMRKGLDSLMGSNHQKEGHKSTEEMKGDDDVRQGWNKKGKAVFDPDGQREESVKLDPDVGWEEEKKSREKSVSEMGQRKRRMPKSASDSCRQRQKYGKSAFVLDTESEETNHEGTSLPRRIRKMRRLDDVNGDSSSGSDNDTCIEPLAENDFTYLSDSEAKIAGSNSSCLEEISPLSKKKLKPGAWTDYKIQKNGKRKIKPSIRCRKSSSEESDTLIVPEVDETFEQWESMDARAKVAAIQNQFHYLENHFRATYKEGKSEAADRGNRRPDLKAGSLRFRGCCLNQGVSVAGEIEGVRAGQVFRYREELCLLGIHRPSQSGIDYITASNSRYRDSKGNGVSVAVSIVSAGGYKDNEDDGERTLIFTGQGGLSNKTQRHRKGENGDQQLVKGNLALVNSCELRVPVRVTRGMVDKKTAKKFYVYDSLYDVMESFQEIGASGYKVWKFKLIKQARDPNSLVPDPDNVSLEEVTLIFSLILLIFLSSGIICCAVY